MSLLALSVLSLPPKVPTITLDDFVIEYTKEIDSLIRGYGIDGPIDIHERKRWVQNDRTLFAWAKRAGVELS